MNTNCRGKAPLEIACAMTAAVIHLCCVIPSEVVRVQRLFRIAVLVSVAVSVTSCANRIAACLSPDGRSEIGEAPAHIQRLAREVACLKGEEVREVIIRELGPAHRDIGSGCRIEQWDVDGGVLTFHPAVGPWFVPERGKVIWLMVTSNSALANIVGNFEMYTLPAYHQYRTRFWLGNLDLRADGSYRYVDSGENRDWRGEQTTNFFMLHPSGHFEVCFSDGINEETKLEALKDGTMLGHVVFSPEDRSPAQMMWIKSWFFHRRLTMGIDEPLTFELEKGWEHYWK